MSPIGCFALKMCIRDRPSNDKDITEEQQTKVKASQAITLLLGSDDKLYYYAVSYTHLDVYKRQ